MHRLYRAPRRWGGRGWERRGEGTFKRLLILPGHCCCHQVGHVTELCILKERKRTTGGGSNSKHSGAPIFWRRVHARALNFVLVRFRSMMEVPFPYGERTFQIQRFSLWRRNGTDGPHIGANNSAAAGVRGRKEDGGKARFVLVAGMSAISGDGREESKGRQTDWAGLSR